MPDSAEKLPSPSQARLWIALAALLWSTSGGVHEGADDAHVRRRPSARHRALPLRRDRLSPCRSPSGGPRSRGWCCWATVRRARPRFPAADAGHGGLLRGHEHHLHHGAGGRHGGERDPAAILGALVDVSGLRLLARRTGGPPQQHRPGAGHARHRDDHRRRLERGGAARHGHRPGERRVLRWRAGVPAACCASCRRAG